MGQLRKDLDDLEKNGRVGDWCFHDDDRSMFVCYPHGFQYPDEPEPWEPVHLHIKGPGQTSDKTPCWDWDGNREAPTLSPSINVIGRWHGWLRAGQLVTA